ncbi:MAG TPA: LysM peptidoglycan-binding domain-containing protein [Chondromyces sp.]|nr:LysM peptidoglycan-binding domain-containing protein [Chondromyces sp.]
MEKGRRTIPIRNEDTARTEFRGFVEGSRIAKSIKKHLRLTVAAAIFLGGGLFASETLACEGYHVKEGDTWKSLSESSGFTVSYLQQINGKTTLNAGDTIVLPSKEELLSELADGKEVDTDILLEKKDSGKDLSNMSVDSEVKAVMNKDYEYTVQRGDYLYKLAREFDTTVKKLVEDNQLSSRVLQPGQKILIKDINSYTEPMVLSAMADATTAHFTKEDGSIIILQIPYERSQEFQQMLQEEVDVTYLLYNELAGKMLEYK